jgi:cytochrome c biogenesis protein ResB
MDRLRSYLMPLTVFLMVFLVYVSILSAFYGSARASVFFNSAGMSAFWAALLIVLVIGLLALRPLHRNPGFLLVHLACIMVLAGSIWGSRTMHGIRNRILGGDAIYEGWLTIHEGTSENRLLSSDRSQFVGELPFSVALKKFSIVYHPKSNGEAGGVSQYVSDVIFISPTGTRLADSEIAVNHPGRYGGYYLYQSSYGRDSYGVYTVLHMKAAAGLHVVYAGYALMCLGVIWSLWFRILVPAMRRYGGGAADAD